MRRCKHEIYWPEGDPIAFGCQQCNPNGMGDGQTPILPRSSGDPLNADKTAELSECPDCGCIRTFSSNQCLVCGKDFPDTESRVQEQANSYTPGTCPNCASTCHYELTKARWECADCGQPFAAPKGKQ